MAVSFQELVEQLAPQAEPRPEAASGPRPAAPAFGALAELLTPAAPRPAPATPAFGALAELLTVAPRPAPVGDKPIVLIACSDTKIDTKGRRVPAADLYSSALFRKSLAYARAITTEDRIRILSGLYGVIPTSQRIATYNYPITKLGQRDRERWGAQARTKLLSDFGKQPRVVIILAGEEYVNALGGLPWTMGFPFGAKRGDRMQIGQRLHWLNEQLRALGQEPPPALKKPVPLKPGRVRMKEGRRWRTVEALAWDGDLFVHEDLADDDLFNITHAPTGRAWLQQFVDEGSAVMVAADLNDPALRPLFDQLVDAAEREEEGAAKRYARQIIDLLDQRAPLRAERYKRAYGREPPADAVAPASEKAPPSEQLSVRAPAPPFAALAELLGAPSPAPVPAPPPTPVPPSGERRSTKPASSVAAWSYLGTVGGHMVWPDVGTRVRWNEDTQERRGKVVRHGTREYEGTITRVEVDEMNPRDTDVWGRPDGGGAERRLGIGGIRIPTVDLPAFRERAEHWFQKRMTALYGEWPPAPEAAPPPAERERQRIAQFLRERASRFAPVWPAKGQEAVNATHGKIAVALREAATTIARLPTVTGQTALEARVAATQHLRNVAAKTKGKAGEALFVAANDIQGGLHLHVAEEEPASSAPDPRVRVAAMTKPRPAPEVAKAPSFADLAASLEAVAPAERIPAAAPVSIASQRERENIVAYLKRQAASAERGGAKLTAQQLDAIADEVAKMTMPAAELRRAVIERLITYAHPKTAEELRESKHYTKGELAAIQAAEGQAAPGSAPTAKTPALKVPSVPRAGEVATVFLQDGTPREVDVLGRDGDLIVHADLVTPAHFALTHTTTNRKVAEFGSREDALAFAMDLNRAEIRPLFEKHATGDESVAAAFGKAMQRLTPGRLERWRIADEARQLDAATRRSTLVEPAAASQVPVRVARRDTPPAGPSVVAELEAARRHSRRFPPLRKSFAGGCSTSSF